MTNLLPSIEEISEQAKNRVEDRRKTSALGVTARRKGEWLDGIEKDKFLNDAAWNLIDPETEVMATRIDHHQSKFEQLKKQVSETEYKRLISTLSDFISRCIPKPFRSLSLRGEYNGWTISCLPKSNLLVRINVGNHVAADAYDDGTFHIFIEKTLSEQIYDRHGYELKKKCDGIEIIDAMEFATKTMKDHNIIEVSIPITKCIGKEFDDSRLILAIRSFVVFLINRSRTKDWPAQCESLVQELLNEISNKSKKI